MSIITRMRKQTAVWWPQQSAEVAGMDHDRFGQPQVSDPVQISVRWEDVSEEFIDSNNTRQLSRARVYVDRDMSVGDILMLGKLTDITDAVNPKENINAWEVRRFEKLPNIKNTEQLRTVFL